MKKKNKQLRYFKSSSLIDVSCALLILVGFIIYRYSWEIWMLGTPLLAIGVIGLIISFAFKVNDLNYGEYFEKKLADLPDDRDNQPDYIAGEYAFDGNHFAKLDKTGAPRSEIFVITKLYLGKTLKVVTGRANAETEEVDMKTLEFSNAAASVENAEIKVGGSVKKTAVMTITGGEQSCRFPVKYYDIEIDDLMNKINKKYSA